VVGKSQGGQSVPTTERGQQDVVEREERGKSKDRERM
jgi:hypothetical protein